MRHYIEDPDNEDRLLKIPFRVIAAIKAEAYKEAIQAIKYEHGKYGPTVQKNTLWGIELAMDAIEHLCGQCMDLAAIENLGEKS